MSSPLFISDGPVWPAPIPKGTVCHGCNQRDATEWWAGDGGIMAANHGFAVPRCMVCILTAQVKHAEEIAARLPDLRAQLEAERRR